MPCETREGWKTWWKEQGQRKNAQRTRIPTRILSEQPTTRLVVVNGQNERRKGKVTASPKVKVKGKAKARENIQEKGTTTRTRLDLQMKQLDSACWMILVENVRELNLLVMSKSTMMILKCPKLIEQLAFFCVHKCKSVMTDWPEMPSSSRRVISGVQGGEEPAGTHETKPDQST